MSYVDYAMDPAWDAPADTDPPPARTPVRRETVRALLRRWVVTAALAAALAGGGWLAVQHYQLHLAGAEALDAATAYALRLTNIDAANIDQSLADIAEGSTGDLHGRHLRSGDRMRRLLVDHKASAHGHITEALVKSATRDEAVVVLLVTQAVRNADSAEPVLDRSRIRMTMDRIDGHWLASKVELI